jgi:cytochrome c553
MRFRFSKIATLAICAALTSGCEQIEPEFPGSSLVQRGEYLAKIGVCAACHTPPKTEGANCPATESPIDLERRTNPDWLAYLDETRPMAGGVPFLIRFDTNTSGVVHSRNITPDPNTGIGNWTDAQIKDALRNGRRPDGTAIIRFPPHTFYEKLAEDDLSALVAYLRSLKPVQHAVLPSKLPFPMPAGNAGPAAPTAPTGRSNERADYLMASLVGCKECHSHNAPDGTLRPFIGGDPSDPVLGVFRLGPDLPLRQNEQGLATFPYPGYALLWGPNLTQFGHNGPEKDVPASELVKAIRTGVSPENDRDGRPGLLAHVMMWQFYKDMSDDDAYSIANYLKALNYVPHETPTIKYFGADRNGMFKYLFNSAPSASDQALFGLNSSVNSVACGNP